MRKEKREKLEKPKMVLMNFFEEVVDPASHFGSRGLSTKVLGTMPPVDTLSNLQRLYGIHLNEPMNRMQPVEVMIRGIK